MHSSETFESVAKKGKLVLCISADEALSDFAVTDISEGPPLRSFRAGLVVEGRTFVGIVALSDGAPATLFNVEVAEETMQMLAAVCVAHINAKFEAAMRSVGMPAVGLPTMKECA